jgi:hypothetical protein
MRAYRLLHDITNQSSEEFIVRSFSLGNADLQRMPIGLPW